jgi:hypothetical protein
VSSESIAEIETDVGIGCSAVVRIIGVTVVDGLLDVRSAVALEIDCVVVDAKLAFVVVVVGKTVCVVVVDKVAFVVVFDKVAFVVVVDNVDNLAV